MGLLSGGVRRWTVLSDMIREHDWRLGAELGVFQGKTFLHLLSTCPDLHLIGVDLWQAQPEKDGEIGGRSYSAHDLEAYHQKLRVRMATYIDRCSVLRMATVDAAKQFPDGYFDFAFIDADHTYEGVKADIEAWRPKVSKCLTGHDWNEEDFPGVIQAVREAFGEPQIHPCNVWSVSLSD